MLAQYRGRLALITGGASGIGLGMAEAFAARGMAVALADIDLPSAEQQAARLRGEGASAMALRLDVRDPDEWTAALDAAEAAFGPLAVLCANAGVAGSVMPLTETEPAGWRWTMEVNLDGCFLAIRLGGARLLAHGKPAHFVATASMGAFGVIARNGPYSAAKAAVVALCEAFKAEVAGTGVGVSVLCPGLVRTSLLKNNEQLAPGGVVVGGHDSRVATMMQDAPEPRSVGEIVADGVAAGRFWLFNSDHVLGLAEARTQAIAADLAALHIRERGAG